MYGTLTHGSGYSDGLAQAVHDMIVYGKDWIDGYQFRLGKEKIKKHIAKLTATMLRKGLALQWLCNAVSSWLREYVVDEPVFTNPFHILKTMTIPEGFNPVFHESEG